MADAKNYQRWKRLGGKHHMYCAVREKKVIIGTRNKQSYFSLNKKGRTHLIYLGKQREPRVREYSANYKKMLDIIEEMTILNMKLLKEKACL